MAVPISDYWRLWLLSKVKEKLLQITIYISRREMDIDVVLMVIKVAEYVKKRGRVGVFCKLDAKKKCWNFYSICSII